MKKIVLSIILLVSVMSLSAQNHIEYDVRYSHHPEDFKKYDTEKIRKEFLMEKVFEANKIHMMYTMYERCL